MHNIKHLCADDVDLMKSLLNLFGDVFDQVDIYCGNQPDTSYLKNLLGKEHFITLVALASDEVIGGLVAYQLDKFEQARSEIYIYDLAVHESHRRRGVATALVEKLKRIAVDRGVYVIFVQADYIDEPAIALYQNLGIQEKVLHFDIAVKS